MRSWLVSKVSLLNNWVHLSNEYLDISRLLFLQQVIWVKKMSSNGSGQDLMQRCKKPDLWDSWAPCFLFFLNTTESPLLLYGNGYCSHDWDLPQEHCGCNLSPSVCHSKFFINLCVRKLWNVHVCIGQTKFVRHSSSEVVFCLLVYHTAINYLFGIGKCNEEILALTFSTACLTPKLVSVSE